MGKVSPLDEADPRTVGPYQLRGRLRADETRTVFVAKDPDGARVVVTVVGAQLAAEPGFRSRLRERTAAARRVVPFATAAVLDVDTEALRPFVVTEYVSGPTLADAVLGNRQMSVAEVARVAGGVANALAAVHAAGIAHQHLDPNNVVLSASGLTRLVDDAVPRPPHGAATLRQTGFAAPEELLGEPGSPAGDVYAWGALVLFAATGRLPHGDGHPHEVVHRILHAPPDLTGLDRRLAPVVAAALAVQPAARPSAQQLVAALLIGTPSPAPGIEAAVVRALRVAASGVPAKPAPSKPVLPRPAPPSQPVPPKQAPSQPAPSKAPAVPPRDDGRRPTSQRRAATTTQPIPPPTDPPPTGPLPTGTRQRSGPLPIPSGYAAPAPAGLGPRLTAWLQAAKGRLRRPFFLLPAALCLVAAILLSYVTFSGSDMSAVQPAGMIQPGSASAAEPVFVQPRLLGGPLVGHADDVTALAFAPDGATLATAGTDDAVLRWDLADPARPRQLGRPITADNDDVGGLAFSPDGAVLAAADGKETGLWNVTDLSVPRRFGPPLAAHTDDVTTVAISPDGTVLASGSADRTVVLWDITGSTVHTRLGRALVGHTDEVCSVAYSPDQTTLVTASDDGTAILWDVTDPADARPIGEPLTGHSDDVLSAVFSPDGTILATASLDRTVILWDVSTPTRPRQLSRPIAYPTHGTRSVAFSPDGRLVATAGDDGTVGLWDVTNPEVPHPAGSALIGHSDVVNAVAFSPDGTILASASDDATVRLWSLVA